MTKDLLSACRKQIIVEFDKVKGIIHFTSDDKLYIDTPEKIACIGNKITNAFKKHFKCDKLFVVMNFNAFIVDIDFAKTMLPFSKKIISRYIRSDGIIGYGHSVSRLAFKMNMKKLDKNHNLYFDTKNDAFKFIDECLKKDDFDFEEASLHTTPVKIDKIDVIPITHIPDLTPR